MLQFFFCKHAENKYKLNKNSLFKKYIRHISKENWNSTSQFCAVRLSARMK